MYFRECGGYKSQLICKTGAIFHGGNFFFVVVAFSMGARSGRLLVESGNTLLMSIHLYAIRKSQFSFFDLRELDLKFRIIFPDE